MGPSDEGLLFSPFRFPISQDGEQTLLGVAKPIVGAKYPSSRAQMEAFLRRVRERRAVCSGSLPLKAKEKGVVALNLLYFPYLFISTNKAVVNMISNLVNSTVPIAVEIFKKAGTYDEKKLFGVTTLDVIRKNISLEYMEQKALRLEDEKVRDLEEQVRDLMVYIEAEKTIELLQTSNEIKDGTVLPIRIESSS
ncbi:hypothetical protein HHK36_007737 [Tetracentron sinense]|uniref:Uncharacterized protein n=1 Tax=Tetracentron sinense TaxID=13715 RepID=A0A835DJC6_TETSI|nr:hypothetical protein HHK36_007737 [Tetracentron sinense]